MASSAIKYLSFLLLLLQILFTAVSGRPGHFHPCKTLMISYSLTSSSDSNALSQNPNPNGPNSFRVFTIYRVIRPFRFYENPSALPSTLPRPIHIQQDSFSENQVAPYLGISNSVRDRAKDILVVVVGLLFGVGCGALTAATMYLVWSLVSNRYDVCGSNDFDYEDEEGYDDIESPKKMGYASVPLAPATPVKEGYEGN